MTHEERWQKYVEDYAKRQSEKDDQPCLARQCAQQIIMDQGLAPGTPVGVMIVCPCPRCNRVRM